MSVTFIADVGPFECHYAGTGGFTYETGSGKNVMHVAGIKLTPGSEICAPEEGDPTYEGDLALTTESDGSSVWVQ